MLIYWFIYYENIINIYAVTIPKAFSQVTTLSDKFPNVQFSSRQFLKGKALAAAMGAERCG